MASVSDFVKDEATVTVEGGSEPTKLTYRPAKITAAGTAQLQRYIEERDALAFARHFCEIVSAWNLEGPLYGDVPTKGEDGQIELNEDGTEISERKLLVDSGEIIPLNPTVIQYIPQVVLTHMWTAVNEDMVPDPQTGRGSRRR
jgi:hypothetical protein